MSLVTFGVFPILISHFGNYRPPRASVLEPQRPAYTCSFAFERSAPQAAEDVKLDAAERQRVIDGVIENLEQHYIDPEVAQKMADALLAHEKSGDDNAVTDGVAFAALLTKQMRDVSHDLHLEVVYSQTPLPDRPTGPTPERLARYRRAMEQENCTFEEVEVLPHNIGYLKLNSFPEPSICRPTATAAMASLNHVDAIIFDLRDNRGGYPDMVMLIAAYLFDHPEYMYNPRENTTRRSWTRSPVPGNRLASEPVYVLTSARTFSGAEHFSYNLKMLKRATLVGETTGGATDVGVFHRIDDHFGMGIRETRAINPYSEPDWAVTGVEPDVKVKAADALKTAEKLAESKLQKKSATRNVPE
jgi:peptidase S41-like protein